MLNWFPDSGGDQCVIWPIGNHRPPARTPNPIKTSCSSSNDTPADGSLEEIATRFRQDYGAANASCGKRGPLNAEWGQPRNARCESRMAGGHNFPWPDVPGCPRMAGCERPQANRPKFLCVIIRIDPSRSVAMRADSGPPLANGKSVASASRRGCGCQTRSGRAMLGAPAFAKGTFLTRFRRERSARDGVRQRVGTNCCTPRLPGKSARPVCLRDAHGVSRPVLTLLLSLTTPSIADPAKGDMSRGHLK
jgi:hypothetical protein